jgi:hypothetical protein
MRRHSIMIVALALVVSARLAPAQTPGDKERKELAAALKDVKVSLTQGLTAAAKEGRPISAKFEVEESKLQLSVYVEKGKGYSEVVVDHKTGKVAKSEPISGGEDLTAARGQAETMSRAKVTLNDVTSRALKANPGYTAVSVTPVVNDGSPTADVVLMKGDERKVVTESLY